MKLKLNRYARVINHVGPGEGAPAEMYGRVGRVIKVAHCKDVMTGRRFSQYSLDFGDPIGDVMWFRDEQLKAAMNPKEASK